MFSNSNAKAEAESLKTLTSEKQMNKILVWEEGGSGRAGEEYRLEQQPWERDLFLRDIKKQVRRGKNANNTDVKEIHYY